MKQFSVDPRWTDKDSRVERFRELYERNDFLTAYSKHTDLRMRDDPKWAIGRGDEWESHGELQLRFLIKRGLRPSDQLLDVGCGPGRAARRFVPYLNRGHYYGTDISASCLEHAATLAAAEGWADKQPRFILNSDLNVAVTIPLTFIWAHSVFTHLPEVQIEIMVRNAAKLLASDGQFLFTYKRGVVPERTGLKQWRYPFQFFERIAERYGLLAQRLDTVWPASQRTGVFSKAV